MIDIKNLKKFETDDELIFSGRGDSENTEPIIYAELILSDDTRDLITEGISHDLFDTSDKMTGLKDKVKEITYSDILFNIGTMLDLRDKKFFDDSLIWFSFDNASRINNVRYGNNKNVIEVPENYCDSLRLFVTGFKSDVKQMISHINNFIATVGISASGKAANPAGLVNIDNNGDIISSNTGEVLGNTDLDFFKYFKDLDYDTIFKDTSIERQLKTIMQNNNLL